MTEETAESERPAASIIRDYERLRGIDPDNPLLVCVRLLHGGQVMIKEPNEFYDKFNPNRDDTYRIEIMNYSRALQDALKEKETV